MKKILPLFLCALMLISSCQKADSDIDLELQTDNEIEQQLEQNTDQTQNDNEQKGEAQYVLFFVIDNEVIALEPGSAHAYTVKNPSDILILSSIDRGILYSTLAYIHPYDTVEFITGADIINGGSQVFKELENAEDYMVSCLERSLYSSNEISLKDYTITSTTSSTEGSDIHYQHLATGTPTNHSLLVNNNNKYENACETLELVAISAVQKLGDYYIVTSEPTFSNLYKEANFADNVLLYAEDYFRFYTKHTSTDDKSTSEHIYAMADTVSHTIANPLTASFFLDYHDGKIFLRSIHMIDDNYNTKLQYIDTNTKKLVDLELLTTPIAIKDAILYYISDENKLCTLDLSTLEVSELSEKLSDAEYYWSGYIVDGKLNVIARELNINYIELHETFDIN